MHTGREDCAGGGEGWAEDEDQQQAEAAEAAEAGAEAGDEDMREAVRRAREMDEDMKVGATEASYHARLFRAGLSSSIFSLQYEAERAKAGSEWAGGMEAWSVWTVDRHEETA